MSPKQVIQKALDGDDFTNHNRSEPILEALGQFGYVIVPKEATPTMLRAAGNCHGCAAILWEDMIAADAAETNAST